MVRKILKYCAVAIACLIVLGLSGALSYRTYLQRKIAQQRAITSPHGIDSLEPVRIGGIDQWIQVRGQNVDNPVLLFIHGGPGIAFIPLAGSFQSSWEKSFTVVEWDQRGTGKTYASNDREIQRRTMNVAQMEHDTVEVVNYLRNRFHRKKIFVVGHSWGSVLGLWLAHEHAELIYAYVGVGQIINTPQNDKVAYQNALQQARIRQNPEAVKDLESIAPFDPPDVDFRKGSIARRWEAQLLGPPASGADFTDPARLLTDLISSPDYTLVDDYSFIRGQSLSMNVLLPAVSKLDLRQLGSDFRAPVFFFEGKYDPYCIPSLIWDYNQTIRAPQKEFVWFDNSGHFPFFEEPQKFSDELVRRLLPLVTAAQKR